MFLLVHFLLPEGSFAHFVGLLYIYMVWAMVLEKWRMCVAPDKAGVGLVTMTLRARDAWLVRVFTK